MHLNSNNDVDMNKVSSSSRWQMNRMGILNFWHYDEEEFVLEDGRIILRGSNGSGKSVTMQSFLPLVLDGDKRPQRLDPFGSRDRRLEYYLLGDGEEGHTDRTGYLWIEFYHTGKKIYKTIGIGLRARRGVTQIGFWGFLLDDGRRISHDFWLYDREVWQEEATKIPLNRKRLEEIIDLGGQVVQEQGTYRDMVNKALFGFQDIASYQDLLKLLLELRSPKLSKDFKPSSMYEILTRALPPLHDADLTPLTDVLENMDQISDRLEELKAHRVDIENLYSEYDQYCNFLLNMHSKNLLDLLKQKNQMSQEVRSLNDLKQQSEQEETSLIDKIELARQQLEKAEAELEILNKSEVIEKQRELEVSEEMLKDTQRQLKNIGERMDSNSKTAEKVQSEILTLKNKISILRETQLQIIDELEGYSRMMEFQEHDIYHGLWQRSANKNEHRIMNWKKDLEAHKKSLMKALETARELDESSKSVAEAEIQLGEVHKERNLLEEQYSAEEDELDRIKQTLKEEILQWHERMSQFTLEEEQLRECLRAVTKLTPKERQYNSILQPVTQAFENQNHNLLKQQLELQQQRKMLNEECERVEQEVEQWQNSREPEPDRSLKRVSSRESRSAEMGAPFYASCEFNVSLSESDKARLEETLIQAGLLDAWIIPGGKFALWHKESLEEVWFEPELIEGSTLAAVLHGTPPLNSGLSLEDVQNVLNSVAWSDEAGNTEALNNNVRISHQGTFRMGPLVGSNSSKSRAEYIGTETRLRTKQIEMDRLEDEKRNLETQIKEIENALETNKHQQQQLQNERDIFPNDKELQQQIDKLLETSYRLIELVKQEQKMEVWYKEKVALKREIQLQFIELTEKWSSLKNEKMLNEAIEFCGDYGKLISELSSTLIRVQELTSSYIAFEEQYAGLQVLLEDDDEEKSEYEERERKYVAQTEQLLRLIKEMGIEDIYLQIQQLKQLKVDVSNGIEQLRIDKEYNGKILIETEVKLEIQSKQLLDCESELSKAFENWDNEIKLSVTSRWTESAMNVKEDENTLRKLCKQITTEYGSLYDNVKKEHSSNKLNQIYVVTRGALVDYALELENLESGRMVITSKQDRHHPLSLKQLLEEVRLLEEEQQLLLTEKDRELYEEIILSSVGRAIRLRIHRARDWVIQMNELMKQRDTSSGLQLCLQWTPRNEGNELEFGMESFVELLLKDSHRLDDEEVLQVTNHFRNRILIAKQNSNQEYGTFQEHIFDLLDYRTWFKFTLLSRKREGVAYKELKDEKFNVLSGGEKAMSMYIPLLAATYSRYSDASEDAPKIISLDEAFAGVDETNIRDMFLLLTDMGFDYMMTSQVLWGCYDSVPHLAIYEIYRPKDSNIITLFHYRWDGKKRTLLED